MASRREMQRNARIRNTKGRYSRRPHVSEPAFFKTLYGIMAPLAERNPYMAAQKAFVQGLITAEQAAFHASQDRDFIATFELDYAAEEGSTPYSAALRIVREQWSRDAIAYSVAARNGVVALSAERSMRGM